MTTPRQQLGTFGERVAKAHLESNGYRVLETNFRVREGEVDIVAQRDDVVVFVEVKTRRGDAMGSAVEAIDWRAAILLPICHGRRKRPASPPATSNAPSRSCSTARSAPASWPNASASRTPMCWRRRATTRPPAPA